MVTLVQSNRNRKFARFSTALAAVLFACVVAPSGFAQTANTGALAGTITDPSGAVVANATVTVTNQATGETRTTVSQANGHYVLPLLPPGTYRVEITKPGFKASIQEGVQVIVTETNALVTHLEIGQTTQELTVSANAEQLQTDTTALGRVTSGLEINSLPLVTRNFTQIIGLNPGIADGGGERRCSGAWYRCSSRGSSANGCSRRLRRRDNNFQMDGVDANDIEASGHFSGGIAIPNPDALEEFKVQTGQYDASSGRNAGANVNVVTKSGTNQFHGKSLGVLSERETERE